MSDVRIEPHWDSRRSPAIVVVTRIWRSVILPALGARVWELEYRPRRVQFLWHSQQIPPRCVPIGACYDNVWSGGWDDIFPTDAPFAHQGHDFPDHGELWNVEWQYKWSVKDENAFLHLWTSGRVTPTRVDKWLGVSNSDPRIDIRYRIQHEGGTSFPFLFKVHPALEADGDSQIVLPRCQFASEAEFCSWFASDSPAFPWPHGLTDKGLAVDLHRVYPSRSRVVLFGHAVDLCEGWCALTRAREKVAFGLKFPLHILKTCCVFASYGGYRNYQVVVLEPCTGDSYRLDDSLARGSASVLVGGTSLEVEVTVACTETANDEEVGQLLEELPPPLPWQVG